MKYMQSNIPLGCDMQPFGALRKCDETTDSSFWSGAGGAAVVGAGSSLIGSLISAGANNYYQKEASEANYEMQKRQLEWNEAMVEKTNKYNSPKAEYNRLLAAGINPILAKYGSNAGSASASQVPQGVNPPYNQVAPNDTGKLIGLGVSDAVRTFMDFSKNQVDIAKTQSDMLANEKRLLMELKNSDVNNKYVKALQDEVERVTHFEDYNWDARTKGMQLQNFIMNMQAKSIAHDMIVADARLIIERALAFSNISVNEKTKEMISQNIANGITQGKILSAEQAIKEFEQGILTDPKNSNNRVRDMWNNTLMKHLKYTTTALGDLINDVVPLRQIFSSFK